MYRTILILGIACCLTATAQAGVELGITQGGGNAPSGSRDEMNTNQDDAILLELNNEIAGRTATVTDPVAPLSHYTPIDTETCGEILSSASAPEAGGTNSKAIYDRLSVRAVLRLLLYDDGGLDYVPPVRPFIESAPNNFPAGDGGVGGASGGGSGGSQAIPEPTTLVLLGGAGALAVLRRRRKTA